MKIINNINNTPRQIKSGDIVSCSKTLYIILKGIGVQNLYVLYLIDPNKNLTYAASGTLETLVNRNNLVFVTDNYDIVLNNPAN